MLLPYATNGGIKAVNVQVKVYSDEGHCVNMHCFGVKVHKMVN